ncbi:hypothetical protein [Saccharothrix sp. ST-888]|uniref:hypothetical protein n=1 Tax=Saccharothrix sp. ST-888 TaxID=1427391 RepID=UPI000B2118C9|nr:hypothetical protein [Saccharothrix sp. ST-888]
MSVKPEHTPRPGVTWQTQITTAERIVPDEFDAESTPQPNRTTRRAQKRAARKNRR